MKDAEISSDDGFESNFDSAEEDSLSAYEKDEDHRPLLSSTTQCTHEPEDAQPSNSLTQAKNPTRNSSLSVPLCVINTNHPRTTHTDSPQPTPTDNASSLTPANNPLRNSTSSAPSGMCVICDVQVAPAHTVGSRVYPTCGKKCASILQASTDLPDPNHPRTSGPSLNSSLGSWSIWPSLVPSWSSDSAPSATQTRSQSRPNQLRMCDVCHVRPRYQKGGKTYPTCGLSCAAKMNAPGSIEMCDYCKKRPRVVVNGRMYPQCGKTCRDKAKLAETAANAAACTSCILCWKMTKAKVTQSDFCSQACHNLADARAPFLIEIPRGHVSFKQVAEFFTSGWQKSNTHCPTVKRIYMVAMKPNFVTSFEKYRTKIASHNGMFQRRGTERRDWLIFTRECRFGDPGDLEPCSSKKCLLCCIVRSSFSLSDFPAGITTSTLNRTVDLNKNGKKASSKIAALTHVLVGREAKMTRQQMRSVRPIPPQNSDSIHVIEIHNDGSKVDLGDIVVYDGDAVRPLYLISYE